MKPTPTFSLVSFAAAFVASTASAQDADGVTPPPAQGASQLTTQAATGGFPNSAIFTNIPGSPTADVPGLPGVVFDPGTGSSDFDRIYGTGNGMWALTAFADLGTTEDELLFVNGTLILQEGQQAPWAPAGELVGTMDTKIGINSTGDILIANNTGGTAVSTADDYIVQTDSAGSTWTALAQEGLPTGLASIPGSTWDDTMDSPILDDLGNAGWSADGIDGVAATTEDDIIVLGGVALMQEGITVPPGQLGAEFIENYDLSDYFVSADGSTWMVQGDLTGSTTTDDVLIVDGAVVLQEGVVIPGSGFVDPIDANGIVGCDMDGAGNWYARGNNDVTEVDWVVRNGTVIATLGDSVDGVSAEAWSDAPFSDCFFLHTGNSLGDYVIGGVTDNADDLRNGLLVLNGSKELVREGDPVDVDGNGMFDDDVFFNTFGNDDGLLTDDGLFYIVATIKDGTGTVLGQGLFVIDTQGGGGIGTNYCVASVNSTGSGAIISASGSVSIAANDLVLSAEPIPASQSGVFYYGPAQDLAAFGNGFRCVGSGGVGLFRLPITTASAGLVLTWAVDNTMPPGAAGLLTAGSTWNFQAWYRDPAGGGAAFNLSDGLEVTFAP